MVTKFLSIQSTYKILEIALFHDQRVVEHVVTSAVKASSGLVQVIQNLLKKHGILLENLDFIAINHGPGAFISIRVGISLVNGIYAALGTPLVDINGLEGLVQEGKSFVKGSDNFPWIVALLNAYGNEVYFLISHVHGDILAHKHMGCTKIDECMALVKKCAKDDCAVFVGNGSFLHYDLIKVHKNYRILEHCSGEVSAKTVGFMAYQKWQYNERVCFSTVISPLYLKTQLFAVNKELR